MLRLTGFFLFLVFLGFSQQKTHTIYFDTDLSKVTNIEKNRLLSFVATLSEKSILSVEIFGFCDDLGSPGQVSESIGAGMGSGLMVS